ncbi:TBC1 domain family member 13 [Smittium culicis]|uniref:TBC1 domain family member 13 n=1 Tax=Smittium culicis TaxID=133412 RepID=A0A1R1Y1F0_9FUNG|nr:TBC1 domain family member 13 [Smittium culicis]
MVQDKNTSSKTLKSKKHISITLSIETDQSEGIIEDSIILQILRDVKRTLPLNGFFKQSLSNSECSGDITNPLNELDSQNNDKTDYKPDTSEGIKSKPSRKKKNKKSRKSRKSSQYKNSLIFVNNNSESNLASNDNKDGVGKSNEIYGENFKINEKISKDLKDQKYLKFDNLKVDHISPTNRKKISPEFKNIEIQTKRYGKNPFLNEIALADLRCFAVSDRYINKFKSEMKGLDLAREFIITPPRTHLDIIARILFVYACLNKRVGYVQGMNELVATFYYVLVNDAPNHEDKIAAEADAFYLLFNSLNGQTLDNFIKELDEHEDSLAPLSSNSENSYFSKSLDTHSSKNIQSLDLTNNIDNRLNVNPQNIHQRKKSSVSETFFSILEFLKEGRVSSPKDEDNKASLIQKQGGIQRMLWKWWNEYLKPVDPELWEHMNNLGYKPEDFALRWLLVWCSREFELKNVVRIWDTIISDRAMFFIKEKAKFANLSDLEESSINSVKNGKRIEKNYVGSSEKITETINNKKVAKKDTFFSIFGSFLVPTISDGYNYSYAYPYDIHDDHIFCSKKSSSSPDSSAKDKDVIKSELSDNELSDGSTIKSGKQSPSFKIEFSLNDSTNNEPSNVNHANRYEEDLENETSFLMDICVAMMLTMREKILKSDFSEGMMSIQSYTREGMSHVSVETLLGIAKSIKSYRTKYRNRMPISGLIGDLKRKFALALYSESEKSNIFKIENERRRSIEKKKKLIENSRNVKRNSVLNILIDKKDIKLSLESLIKEKEPIKLVSTNSEPVNNSFERISFSPTPSRIKNELKDVINDEKILSKVYTKMNKKHRYSRKLEGRISKNIKSQPIKINLFHTRNDQGGENSNIIQNILQETFSDLETFEESLNSKRVSKKSNIEYIKLKNTPSQNKLETDEKIDSDDIVNKSYIKLENSPSKGGNCSIINERDESKVNVGYIELNKNLDNNIYVKDAKNEDKKSIKKATKLKSVLINEKDGPNGNDFNPKCSKGSIKLKNTAEIIPKACEKEETLFALDHNKISSRISKLGETILRKNPEFGDLKNTSAPLHNTSNDSSYEELAVLTPKKSKKKTYKRTSKNDIVSFKSRNSDDYMKDKKKESKGIIKRFNNYISNIKTEKIELDSNDQESPPITAVENVDISDINQKNPNSDVHNIALDH